MGRELAEHDRTRLGQTPDRSCILCRHMVDHHLRMPCGRNAFGLIDVLQADRDAVQRPAQTPCDNLGLGRASRRERLVGEDTDERVELAVEPLDARQAALYELDRGELALGDKRTSFGDGQEIRDHCHSPGGGKI